MATLLPSLKNIIKTYGRLTKAAVLVTVLLAIACKVNAQVYYMVNAGDPTKPDANDGIRSYNNDGTVTTLASNFTESPLLFQVDLPNNRAFVYEGYALPNKLPGNTAIKVVNLTTGALIKSIPIQTSSRVSSIKYDAVNNYIYFTLSGESEFTAANANDALIRVKPDGTGYTAISSGLCKNPGGVALDVKNNRAFVLNNLAAERKIITVDLTTGAVTNPVDFTNKQTLPGTTLDMVYDIATDFIYMLGSDAAYAKGDNDMIYRIRPDGSGYAVIAKQIANQPNYQMAGDFGNEKIYFVDCNPSSGNTSPNGTRIVRTIGCVNISTGAVSTAVPDGVFGNLFVTGVFVPQRAILSSVAASSVSSTTATLGGNIVQSDATVTERGIVYSKTNVKPIIGNGVTKVAHSSGGTGAFSMVVSGVEPITTYYARAYASSSAGVSYGDVITFSTISNNANLSSLSISAGTLSPAFATETISYTANVTYDKTTITVTPTLQQANATVKVNGTAVTSATATSALNLLPGTNTITTVVTAQDGIATKTYTTVIIKDKNPQAITFNALTAKTYGNADFNLGASASSTLPVTYTSDNNNVATVTDGVVHIVGAGTVNITAAQAGNTTYLAAANVTQQLTVNKATLTYNANAASRDYGAANPTFTGTVTGYVNGDTQATATTGTLAFTSTADATSPVTTDNTTVINYPITGSGLSAANYTFVQATANNTALTLNKIAITYTAQAATKVYGSANPSFNVVFAGMANGQTIGQIAQSAGYATTATTNSAVGSYPINVTGLTALNYTFAPATANAAAFTITKAGLTFTANAATRTYGTANPVLSGTITGFVNGESVVNLTGTASYTTTATATSNVGSYPITLTGLSSANYTIAAESSNNTALTITKGTLSYVADPASRAFNTSPNPALTGTVTGFANGETLASATTGTATFTTTVTQSTPVGSYAILGSGLNASNYDIVQSPVNANAFSIYLSSNGNLNSLAISQGALSPAFSSGVNAYTATVSTGTTSITVTPAVSDANARVTVNGTEVNSGAASASIQLNVGPNTIHVNVTAQDGTTTNPYTIVVTRLPSDDATLTGFSIAGITLPTPDAYNNYRINVANTVESYDVSAIVHEPNATIRINNIVVASGATTTIPLHLGENVNNILVTAQDGTSYGYTGVIITRAYKSNNLLSSLTVNTGTLSPAFDSAITDYTLEVSNSTTTVDMTPEYDETAAGSEDGFPTTSGSPFTTVQLSIGDNEIPITIRAQDGTPKNYKVVIKRAVSTDATLADLGIITTISGLDVPFDANTDTYNTTVSSDVTTFRLKPTANNSEASITVNGSPLDTYNGSAYTMKYFTVAEPVIIEVTAGDGATKKTYTVNVMRNFSTNNLLATFGINSFPVAPDFDPAVKDYTINISDPTILSLSMFPLAQDALSEVKVNGITVNRGSSPYLPIHGGANIITVKVTAFGAGENIYTLTVNRAYSASADLAAVSISAGAGNAYNHNFQYQYGDTLDIDVPNNVSSLSVAPYAVDQGGTIVTVNGYATANQVVQVPIALGGNDIAITITSGDNTVTKSYTLHIERLPFVDVTLSALTTTSGVLTPAFSPEVTAYTVVLPSTATTFSFSPVATLPTSVVTVNSGVIDSSNPTYVYPFTPGSTTNVSAVVTAPDGINTKSYRITFVKPTTNTAVLGNLSLSRGALSPAFARNTLSYTASVPYSASSVNITPYSPDPAVVTTVTYNSNTTTISTLTPSVTLPLSMGANTVTVTTKSPNGSVSRTYTLAITRGAPATDATLASLYVDNANISPVFSALQDNYTADVYNSVTSTFIRPTVADTTATVTVAGVQVPRGANSASIALNQGNNIITTIVTAESGATKTYTTTINRLTAATDADLANLLLTGGTLDQPFTKSQLNYASIVVDTVTSLTLIPLVNDAYATVTVNGVAPDIITGEAVVALDGLNTIEIAVTAQDGTTIKTYTITINRVQLPTLSYTTPANVALGSSVNIAPTGSNLSALRYRSVLPHALVPAHDRPADIVTDKQGNIFIVDENVDVVTELPANGGAAITRGTGYSNPQGVALDTDGNLFVTCYNAAGTVAQLIRIDAGSDVTTVLATGFHIIGKVAVDKSGVAYVIDNDVLISGDVRSGYVMKVAAGGGTPVKYCVLLIRTMLDIAVTSTGDVYITGLDSETSSSLSKLTPTFRLKQPSQGYVITVNTDAADNIYYSFQINVGSKIYKISASDNYFTNGQRGGGISEVFNTPDWGLLDFTLNNKGVIYGTRSEYADIAVYKPMGGYFINKPLPAGLFFDVSTGVISGKPTALTAAQDYIITAWNDYGSTDASVNLAVTPPSSNADLSNLTLSSGTLSPVFSTAVTDYTVSVPAATAAITFTPTVAEEHATLRSRRSDGAFSKIAFKGSSRNFALKTGDNAFIIQVKSQDTTTVKYYNITVNRPVLPPADYGLKYTMSPATTFTKISGPADYNYTTSVATSVSQVTIKPAASDTNAVVRVEGVIVPANAVSAPVLLSAGVTTIHMQITATNGVIKTYEIAVSRNGSGNYGLKYSLSSAAKLVKTTGTATYNFTTSVDPSVTSLRIKATAADTASVVRVEGQVVPREGKSNPIPLLTGINIISMDLTAGDGTVKTYNFAVTRPSLGLMGKLGDDNTIIAAKTDKIALGVIGAGELPTKDITVYPNPFVDMVNISYKGYTPHKAQVEVRDLQGKLEHQQTSQIADGRVSIDLSRLRAGVYIISVTTDGERKVYKIYKN